MLIKALLAAQGLTFLALGLVFLMDGKTRLGVAQLLLCVVQLVIYSA